MKKRLIALLLSYYFIGSICLFSSNLWAIDIVQITNTPGINERHPRIVMKDSSIYVVWWDEQVKLVYFAKSTNNGKNWSTPLQIWSGVCPSIAVSDNGHIYIVWDCNGEILFRKSTNGGFSFEDTVKVESGDATDVAVDSGGNIYIIWTKLKESPPAGKPKSICFSKSTDGGMKFSDPVVVDSTFGTFRYGLRLAVSPSGNNVYVVWAGVPLGGHTLCSSLVL